MEAETLTFGGAVVGWVAGYPGPAGGRGCELVAIVPASLFLLASRLKRRLPATRPLPGIGSLCPPPFAVEVFGFERLVGLWLLAKSGPKATWILGLACFAGVCLVKALPGGFVCGWLGCMLIDPDGSVLALLGELPRTARRVVECEFSVGFHSGMQ
jgi:hypothetical protein